VKAVDGVSLTLNEGRDTRQSSASPAAASPRSHACIVRLLRSHRRKDHFSAGPRTFTATFSRGPECGRSGAR